MQMKDDGPIVLRLANGYSLVSGWVDEHDPDRRRAGDWISIVDQKGKQVFYVETVEFLNDPVLTRELINTIFETCAR